MTELHLEANAYNYEPSTKHETIFLIHKLQCNKIPGKHGILYFQMLHNFRNMFAKIH